MHSLITPDVADQDHRQAWLSAQLAAPVTLVWTENRSSMLSARGNARRGIRCACTACFCRRLMGSGAPLWRICATLMPLPRVPYGRIYGSQPVLAGLQPPQRPRLLQPQGRYFDLEAIYDDLNQLLHQSCASAHYLESPTATAQAQVHTLWFLPGA